jgi:hypothetical protein
VNERGEAVKKALCLRFLLAVLSIVLVIGSLSGASRAQVNVTTWRNDTLRTGQNTSETVLTPSSIINSNFGMLCSASLDGQVYAQPLVLTNLTFQGTEYASLVYVVTQMNTLYVIDGAPPAPGNPCTIVASLSLNPAGQYPTDCHFVGSQHCGTVAPFVGALGTPVIQSVPNSNGTLYVVTETQDVQPPAMPQHWYHYLHAVNLDQLAELTGPVRVFPPAQVVYLPPAPTWINAQASYWSRGHIQRPGLLLAGNYLYIGFSMMDGNMPLFNGSIFRYDVTNLAGQPEYFAVTPDIARAGGGVWQGGAALAYGPDETQNNYIYFSTGNGTWDGHTNFSTSFMKLDPTSLDVVAYFTPADQYYRNCQSPYNDLDFGSGGVLLTPPTSYWKNMALTGDKEGAIYAMDTGTPGSYNQGQCANSCTTYCSPTQQNASNQNLQTVWLYNGRMPAIHNNPAYWNNFIYVAPDNAPILQYQLCNDQGSGQPFCNTTPIVATGPNGEQISTPYGSTPSVSAASESGDAIVWAVSGDKFAESTTAGQLYAFDAVSMSQLYVTSGTGSPCPQVDTLAPTTKFSVPTIANGYVYLGTQAVPQNNLNDGTGTFYVFGLNRQCTGVPAKNHGTLAAKAK